MMRLEGRIDDLERATRRHASLLGRVHRPSQVTRKTQGRDAVVEILQSLLETTESLNRSTKDHDLAGKEDAP